MVSKRDLELVRLAVRWKWLTPEAGEDVLFLKRKFAGKFSLEEVIRRRGYLRDDELDQLSNAVSQVVGRRRRVEPRPDPKPIEPAANEAQSEQRRAEGPRSAASTESQSAPPAPLSRPPIRGGGTRPRFVERSQTIVAFQLPRAPKPEPEVRGLGDDAGATIADVPALGWSPRAEVQAPELGGAQVDPGFEDLGGRTIVGPAPSMEEESGPPEERTVIADPRLMRELHQRLREERERKAKGAPLVLETELKAELRAPGVVPRMPLGDTGDRPRAPTRLPLEAPRPTLQLEPSLEAKPRGPTRAGIEPRAPLPRALTLDGTGRAAELIREVLPLERAPAAEMDSVSTQSPLVSAVADDELVEEEVDAALIGQVISSYYVDRVIARGQRGAMCHALDPSGRAVAIKLLKAEDDAGRRLAARAADASELLPRVRSAHVVPVLEFGVFEGTPYLAMPYVDAWTLADRIDSGELPDLVESLTIAHKLALALAACSIAGLVHGDVNPGNVLIARDGEVLLSGFGLARELFLPPSAPPILGTLGYLAPEQAQGGALDSRTDQFGLGATLFHMLTGRRLLEGVDTEEALALTAAEPPPSLRSVAPALPESVGVLVDRLLALDPAGRHPSIGEVAIGLERALAEVRAHRPKISDDVAALKRRLAGRAGAAALVAAVPLILLPTFVRAVLEAEVHYSAVALEGALFGAVAALISLALVSALSLVRRGELPLPTSSAWLVRLQEGLGSAGAAVLLVGSTLAPLAGLNVVVSLLGLAAFASWLYGIQLRLSIAERRPDRGVGRVLAVLSDPSLGEWRRIHVPLFASLTALAVARFALLAYFAASGGGA